MKFVFNKKYSFLLFLILCWLGIIASINSSYNDLNLLNLSFFNILKKNIFEQNTFENFNYKFDIIFLDPPYKEKNINNLFLTIFENRLLNKNGIIILHRKKSDNDMLPKEFIKIEEKTYGISKIMFFSTLN